MKWLTWCFDLLYPLFRKYEQTRQAVSEDPPWQTIRLEDRAWERLINFSPPLQECGLLFIPPETQNPIWKCWCGGSCRKQPQKRKARTASLWEWLSHTSALLSLLITALVAAQQCKPPSASWGSRSWCLLRVLNQPAAEVRVILFCQLCMHYQCRWHGSSTGLQQMEIFH